MSSQPVLPIEKRPGSAVPVVQDAASPCPSDPSSPASRAETMFEPTSLETLKDFLAITHSSLHPHTDKPTTSSETTEAPTVMNDRPGDVCAARSNASATPQSRVVKQEYSPMNTESHMRFALSRMQSVSWNQSSGYVQGGKPENCHEACYHGAKDKLLDEMNALHEAKLTMAANARNHTKNFWTMDPQNSKPRHPVVSDDDWVFLHQSVDDSTKCQHAMEESLGFLQAQVSWHHIPEISSPTAENNRRKERIKWHDSALCKKPHERTHCRTVQRKSTREELYHAGDEFFAASLIQRTVTNWNLKEDQERHSPWATYEDDRGHFK